MSLKESDGASSSEAAGMRTRVRGYGKAVHTGPEEEKQPNGEGPKPMETLRMPR